MAHHENTQEAITASPLCWPAHFPRSTEQKEGRFGSRNHDGYGNKQLTIAQATSRVLSELEKFTKLGHTYRCDPDSVIISTNLKLRKDNLPRSNQSEPDDSGVCVYFKLDGKDRCIPCDQFTRVADNLAAIAGTLEALRKIERYGSQMFEATFTGFTALPSPDQISARTWREVLNYYGSSINEAKNAYRRLCKETHPDQGGSVEQFQEVQTAFEQAKMELG